MPIIAESEPIVLEIEAPSTPGPQPITPTPPGPTPIVTPSNVLERHRKFINLVNASPACFNKNAIPGFTGEEFNLHLQIAKIDKYVVDAGTEFYCSMSAINKLSKSLERL